MVSNGFELKPFETPLIFQICFKPHPVPFRSMPENWRQGPNWGQGPAPIAKEAKGWARHQFSGMDPGPSPEEPAKAQEEACNNF